MFSSGRQLARGVWDGHGAVCRTRETSVTTSGSRVASSRAAFRAVAPTRNVHEERSRPQSPSRLSYGRANAKAEKAHWHTCYYMGKRVINIPVRCKREKSGRPKRPGYAGAVHHPRGGGGGQSSGTICGDPWWEGRARRRKNERHRGGRRGDGKKIYYFFFLGYDGEYK